jgi:hypothetical protein
MKYFHEDDYCQKEFLHGDSLSWCLQQLDEIDKSSRENWNGSGWDKMFIRDPENIEILDKGINIDELVNKLCPPFNIDLDVITGYSTHREKMINTLAISDKIDSDIFLKQEGKIISAIWTTFDGKFETEAHLMAIIEMMSYYNLFLVDWSWGCIIGPDINNFYKYKNRFNE